MNTHRKLVVLFTALVLPLVAQSQTPAAPSASAGDSRSSSMTPAAQVVLVTGSAKVGARALSAGNKVNAGETIVTGPNSYANLKFADGGRILLRPNTEFTVEAYNYTAAPVAAAPAQAVSGAKPAVIPPPAPVVGQTAFFRLVRGGFRAISGLIGKADQQAYRVTTPVATIGIRGTDYEVQTCAGDCPSETAPPKAEATENVMVAAAQELSGLHLAQADGTGGSSNGMVVATNEGSIVLQTPSGEIVLDVGQVALTFAGGKTVMLSAMPDLLLRNQTASPKDCN